jgi:hypothetical protein
MNNLPLSPKDDSSQANYHSYLLRLWWAGLSGVCEPRASLEDLRTRERIGFANLEELFVFLMAHKESHSVDCAVAPQGEQ